MTISEVKEVCGYRSGIRSTAPRCGNCAHAINTAAKTECDKNKMRVSYFGLCNDYEGPNSERTA